MKPVLPLHFLLAPLSALIAMLLALLPPAVAAQASLWSEVRKGGHVLLIRHAITTPGTGDPPGFVLADCSTQRNLSDKGIADAKRLGEKFRAERIKPTRVLSSEWCRTKDTARLAFGTLETSSMLNSTFADAPDRAARAQAVREFARRIQPNETVVLVTHGNNINAAFDVYTAEGDIVVAKPGADGLKLVGKIAFE